MDLEKTITENKFIFRTPILVLSLRNVCFSFEIRFFHHTAHTSIPRLLKGAVPGHLMLPFPPIPL